MKKIVFLFILLASFPAVSFATQADEDYNTGLQFYQQGQIDKAIQYCQLAVQADPNHWQSYQILGYCYYTEKNNTLALQNLDRSLQLNPNNPALQKFDDQVRAATPSAPPLGSAAAPSTQMGTTPVAMLPVNNTAIAADKRNHNLPKEGKIIFDIVDSDWVGDWTDLNNIYGTSVNSTQTPIGVKLGLGADYVITPNIQLGIRLQGMLKQPETVFTVSETDDWEEYAYGGALALTATLPLNDGTNFFLSGEGGYYTVAGSTLTSPDFPGTTIDLNGSGPGGMVAAGIELLMDSNKSWALDIGLDYQFLTITPITKSGSGSGTLKNNDGSNASFDFSGVGFLLAARFF